MTGYINARVRWQSASCLIDDFELLEVSAEKAAVATQQAISLRHRMGADQEIGHDTLALAAGPSIGGENRACLQCRFDRLPAELDAHALERFPSRSRRGKERGNLAPDDLAGDYLSVLHCLSKRTQRGIYMLRIGSEHVQQYAAVDGANHRRQPGRGAVR